MFQFSSKVIYCYVGFCYFKGIWDQRNNFCIKWSFLTIKQNGINQNLQKITRKLKLACIIYVHSRLWRHLDPVLSFKTLKVHKFMRNGQNDHKTV